MILVTGFQSYGGRSTNPAEAVALGLHGAWIGGLQVAARGIPVDFHAVRRQIPELVEGLAPRIVLSLGLWPGEPMIRLERVAANWSVFEIPDNVGHQQVGRVLDDGPDGYLSTLPHDDIEARIRAAGIPCRQSGSAGTYLCNAVSYMALDYCRRHGSQTRVGFIHLPYLPAQVAQLLDDMAAQRQLEHHQRADYASMSLDVMLEAVRIALQVTVEALES